MKIFKTKEGNFTQEGMYLEFIKVTEQTKEYNFFHKAIVDEEIETQD